MPRARDAPLKMCRRCRKVFKPYQPKQQKYCNRTCRQAAYRERRKCPKCGAFIDQAPRFRRTEAGARFT